MRSQSTPGATSSDSPGAGGVGCGNCSSEGMMTARSRAGRVAHHMVSWTAPGPWAPHANRGGPMPTARRPDTPARVTYTISDLAREFALTTRAIRFYEDCGLLQPERRGR